MRESLWLIAVIAVVALFIAIFTLAPKRMQPTPEQETAPAEEVYEALNMLGEAWAKLEARGIPIIRAYPVIDKGTQRGYIVVVLAEIKPEYIEAILAVIGGVPVRFVTPESVGEVPRPPVPF